MRFFHSAGWLATLALLSISSSHPLLLSDNSIDTRESSTTDHLTQLMETGLLSKRLTSTSCKGLNINLAQVATQASKLCDAAIASIKSKDDATETQRFVHFFGAGNDNAQARSLIAHNYEQIRETIFSLTFDLVCLPKENKDGRPGVIADVVSAGQGSQATVRLFKAWFGLPDTTECEAGLFSKASVLVHESSHVFGADDHGPDQGNDAYEYGDFSASAFGKCKI